MIADCTALILTGGESRRMGQDKARLMLGEKPLLQHVASALQPLFSETVVSVRSIRPDCNLPQVSDDPKHAGPLAGLAAGLAAAKTPWVFAVACDMPFVGADLIARMAKFRCGFDAVVPVASGHPQPLAAFYATKTLATVRELLAADAPHSLRELLTRLSVRHVREHEMQQHDLKCFFDLDTPDDLNLVIDMDKRWNILK